MGHSFLMSTKRRTTLEILAKLKIEIFPPEHFSEFSFAIHLPAHRNLFLEHTKIGHIVVWKYLMAIVSYKSFLPQTISSLKIL